MSGKTVVALHRWATVKPVYHRSRNDTASSNVRRFLLLRCIVGLSPFSAVNYSNVRNFSVLSSCLCVFFVWIFFFVILIVRIDGCYGHFFISSSNVVLSVLVVLNQDSASATWFFILPDVPRRIPVRIIAIDTLPAGLLHLPCSGSDVNRRDRFVS